MCGEKLGDVYGVLYLRGSPPRVRGKACFLTSIRLLPRITPACAGKSAKAERTSRCSWDHPRVCGEKDLVSRQLHFSTGSPPRVRGKVTPSRCSWACIGITPACAGKRLCFNDSNTTPRDHPRVCGEKPADYIVPSDLMGSPPRVRGKDSGLMRSNATGTITPACAGKRHYHAPQELPSGDHPRVCGEKQAAPADGYSGLGSPPRVRGKASCS